MKKVFIKRYWEEEDITFYIAFLNEDAIKQIEISSDGVFLTSEKYPINENSMLYDQDFSDLDLSEFSLISEEEFMKVWNDKK